ncbi:MAG: TM0996/MTH895 family glutaredoxin-like protein [Chitinophagaceae bacterium]|nr:TM0996/MTH895 family glutaredoxin-like protein [Chitinophagaceae bacterium]MBK8951056.1 TM0996/MTH895 family glutaredoxin-like protein [Chitinophagaceae bacterium]
MKQILVIGSGCAKCKTTYNNALEAVKQTGVEASVQKVEDIEEMIKYNVLTTPVLMIDGEAVVKGRVADINEIKNLLTQN